MRSKIFVYIFRKINSLPNDVGPADTAPSDVGASRELGPPPPGTKSKIVFKNFSTLECFED